MYLIATCQAQLPILALVPPYILLFGFDVPYYYYYYFILKLYYIYIYILNLFTYPQYGLFVLELVSA